MAFKCIQLAIWLYPVIITTAKVLQLVATERTHNLVATYRISTCYEVETCNWLLLLITNERGNKIHSLPLKSIVMHPQLISQCGTI